MPSVEIAAVAFGVLLLLLARVQRVKARRVKRMMLRKALVASDPAARRAAIQVVGDDGLSRFAPQFLGLLRHETDPSVLLVLAQVVVRNQWEPASDPCMIRLRLWAHRYLDTTTAPAWRPSATSTATRFQGPTVSEVVNLLLQPVEKRTPRRRMGWLGGVTRPDGPPGGSPEAEPPSAHDRPGPRPPPRSRPSDRPRSRPSDRDPADGWISTPPRRLEAPNAERWD